MIGEDEDERELFVEWQREYARAIRERFAEDFIQVANGRLPQEDAELAGLINGVFYELYPNNPWGMTDREGFEVLLANQAPGYLREAKGRTWSILTNDVYSSNNMFCLVSSLLADCIYTELYGTCTFAGWTLDVRTGSPAGARTAEGDPDSLLTYRRPFRFGEARISFLPSGRRSEVTFDTEGSGGD